MDPIDPEQCAATISDFISPLHHISRPNMGSHNFMLWKIRLDQNWIEKKLLKKLQNKKVTLKNKKFR